MARTRGVGVRPRVAFGDGCLLLNRSSGRWMLSRVARYDNNALGNHCRPARLVIKTPQHLPLLQEVQEALFGRLVEKRLLAAVRH